MRRSPADFGRPAKQGLRRPGHLERVGVDVFLGPAPEPTHRAAGFDETPNRQQSKGVSHGSCPSYGDQLDLDDELRGRDQVRPRAANQTLRNVKSAWIKEQQVRLEGGAIAEYQVNMLVTFVLDD